MSRRDQEEQDAAWCQEIRARGYGPALTDALRALLEEARPKEGETCTRCCRRFADLRGHQRTCWGK